jgi:hypothetical protein
MKQNSGVTLISLTIYIIAMLVVIGTVATLTKYFYNNLDTMTERTSASKQYAQLNAYLVTDINTKDIYMVDYSNEVNNNYFILSNGNQYTFSNSGIYLNKVLICSNVSNVAENEPVFKYQNSNSNDNSNSNRLTVNLKIGNETFSNNYKIESED